MNNDTLMQLSRRRWYTKLYVHNTNNLLCNALGNEWKMTFQTREGVFKLLVMSFKQMDTSDYVSAGVLSK